jgi:hypothetical protein
MSIYSVFGEIEQISRYVGGGAVVLLLISAIRWGRRSRTMWISTALIFFSSSVGALCHLLSRPIIEQDHLNLWMEFALVCTSIRCFSLLFLFAMLKANSRDATFSRETSGSGADHLTGRSS